jgi:hypothetical protein
MKISLKMRQTERITQARKKRNAYEISVKNPMEEKLP